MRHVYRSLDSSSSERPVQHIELGILVRGREARKRKESKEICSPISLLDLGTNAQEALTIAATSVVDGG